VDRSIHLSNYPTLFFPELYILDKGYCQFFEQHPERCTGQYIRMLDTNFEREHVEVGDATSPVPADPTDPTRSHRFSRKSSLGY
jgi:hypothetical protein